MIKAEYIENDGDLFVDYTPNCSARGHLTLIIKGKDLNIDEQKNLVIHFNNYLNNKRKDYHSLFLPNIELSDI